ncbi:NUDIX hydrolase [Rhodocytophaga aerolata]|uniref:GDP-mannose pyrophosphatase n=1 Tax=Rhodocytophaga aerolata TaxID=455078 RepID=A0ABT8R2A2_9BACT|nr:NUDIX hydrolase [Rhodocytophaga aerolata]MDO1446222.1 NUDIX hydrolase [Rhodocytophaga aerolata]
MMEKRNGPWTIQSTQNKYKDEFLELCVDQVIKPNGEPGQYATVKLKSGVAILPIDEHGHVYLTKQFRYAIGKDSLEVISGGIEEEGEPLEAARREAREELGIQAKQWIEAGYFHLETSMIKGPVYLYMAKDLQFTDTSQDDTEDVKKVKMSLDEAVQLVMDSKITHGPSCVLLLKAQKMLK